MAGFATRTSFAGRTSHGAKTDHALTFNPVHRGGQTTCGRTRDGMMTKQSSERPRSEPEIIPPP